MFKYRPRCDGEMRMGVGKKGCELVCDGVGVMGLPPSKIPRQPTDLSVRMGAGVKCDGVGVMSLPPSKYSVNPRIYPWGATLDPSP